MNTKTKMIKALGKEHPIYFGMVELELYEEVSNRPIGELFSALASIPTEEEDTGIVFPFKMAEIVDICFVGLHGGARVTKSKKKVTRTHAIEILDSGEADFNQILTLFTSTLTKVFGGETASQGNAPSPKGRKSQT